MRGRCDDPWIGECRLRLRGRRDGHRLRLHGRRYRGRVCDGRLRLRGQHLGHRSRGMRLGAAAAPHDQAADNGDAGAANRDAHHELARGRELLAQGRIIEVVETLDSHASTSTFGVTLLEKVGFEGVELALGTALAGSGGVRYERTNVGLWSHLISIIDGFERILE